MGHRKERRAAAAPEQPPLGAENLEAIRGGVHLRESVLQEHTAYIVVELQGRRHPLAGDVAHAASSRNHVFGRYPLPTCQHGCRHTAAVAGDADHVVEHVCADVHQAISGVVPLATPMKIAHFADAAVIHRLLHRPHGAARPALVVNGDADPFLLSLGHHLVGLCQRRAHRLFHVDVHPVFEHPHGQVVVKLRPRGNHDDVGCLL